MADSYVQVPADSTGKKIDVTSLDVGVSTVYRQRIVIASDTGTATFATVLSSGPAGTEGGLVVRNIPSGTQGVSGQVSLGPGTSNIGSINNISATLSTVLAAGTANIGSINNISATLSTVLAAGTANIGTVNNISAAVVLAAGSANIGTINGISATVTVVNAAGTALMGSVSLGAGTALIGSVSLGAGTANIGSINNISAPVALAAGSANIGSINNISATVVTTHGVTAIMSASHGPKCVTASSSANVTLIASPGAGLSIYVTQLACSNAGAVGSRARIGTSSSLVTVVMFMASAGGGFVMNFDPPWKLSASEAALCSVKPATSDALFNVNFYVAP